MSASERSDVQKKGFALMGSSVEGRYISVMRNAGSVLIVEDDDDSRELLRFALEDDGWTVAEATNGEDALAQATTVQPMIVLLDVTLPRISGVDVAMKLRVDEATKHIPLVAISGYTLKREQRAHFDDALLKPFAFESVVDVISRLLSTARPSAG